jgi:hypothetical protein
VDTRYLLTRVTLVNRVVSASLHQAGGSHWCGAGPGERRRRAVIDQCDRASRRPQEIGPHRGTLRVYTYREGVVQQVEVVLEANLRTSWWRFLRLGAGWE